MNSADDRANPIERLGGSVERVTFHSEESGFCVLRVKVRGQRDLSTVIGSAASVTAGEYVECLGNWINLTFEEAANFKEFYVNYRLGRCMIVWSLSLQ